MKTLLSKRRVWLAIPVLTLIFTAETLAEGTKQFLPLSTNFGCIQFNDVGRPFALMTNTDPLQRLYFHISSTTERVYFGFSRHSTSVASSGQFQIKNPSGTIVMGPSNIPNGGAGKIASYAEAVAGPKIGGVPAGGYGPLSYTPVTTGDFYIEFSSNNNDNYRFEYFDLTVVNASNVPIDGRLWSYAWDMNNWDAANGFSGSFYVYTSEGYVSRVNMNDIHAYGFVTSCNGTGPQNTGDIVVDRRSLNGNSTRPDFKVFLNNPDPNVYSSANAPTITSPVQIVGGNIYYGSPVQFTVGVSAPGTIQFIISINGVAGYQAGTEDVLVVSNVVAGMNTINWDGKDAYGNYPTPGMVIEISTGFSAGITHLPIYDPETHTSGFIVDRIRPGTGSAPIRWDDSNFSSSVNISGGSGDGHAWPLDGGNVRTMNTWWNGYEVENQDQFTVIVQSPLPIALTGFHIEITSEHNPVLNWNTASETNIDYFNVERSNDLPDNFESAGQVKAFGNSNTEHQYSFTDMNYVAISNYYRISAVDYDGRIVYVSNILLADFSNELQTVDVYPNPVISSGGITLNFNNTTIKTLRVEIVNALLQNVFVKEYTSEGLRTRNIEVDLPQLKKGSYYVRLTADDKVYFKRFDAL